jgi:hypothetical protein
VADENKYLPRDTEKEAKFGYHLPTSLKRNRHAGGHGFLHAKRIFVGDDVGVADVDVIVKAAGGEFLTSLPKKATKDTIVVAIKDSATHRDAAAAGATRSQCLRICGASARGLGRLCRVRQGAAADRRASATPRCRQVSQCARRAPC